MAHPNTNSNLKLVIVLFSIFSIALLAVAWYASGLAPRLMERNYRTVKYAAEMQRALTSFYLAVANAQEPRKEDISRFDLNLAAERNNITEVGEPEIVADLSVQWAEFRASKETPTLQSFERLSSTLNQLSEMNESAMLTYETQAKTLSYGVLVGGGIGFVLVFVYAVQAWLSVSVMASGPPAPRALGAR
ncbi:MAG: hypothetical protein U0136_18940 [Bdellovibrionota bacterium]